MLIVMKPNATASEIDAVVNVVEAVGFRAQPMRGATRTAIGITGNEGPIVLPTDPIVRVDLLSGEKSGPAESTGS